MRPLPLIALCAALAGPALAEQAALPQDLASAQAEITRLRAALEDAEFRANLRPQVKALFRAAESLSLINDKEMEEVAAFSLTTMAGAFGDGCSLAQSVFTEQEREIEALSFGAILKIYAIDETTAGIMISNLHTEDEDPALPHNRMRAALEAARKAGDAETADGGERALDAAFESMNAMAERISRQVMEGGMIAMSEDKQRLELLIPPCGQ